MRNFRAPALAILGVVALHGVLLRFNSGRKLAGDERDYVHRAAQLLAGETPENPLLLWPPLQHRFLAFVAELSGSPPPSLLPLHVLQILLLLVAAALLYDLARRFGASSRGAGVAALFLVAHPPLAAFAGYLWPEVLHLFFFLTLIWLLIARSGLPSALGAGLFLGLALLTKSVLQVFVLPLLILLLLTRQARRALCVFLVCLAVVAPTVVRHHHSHERAVIADSGWFNVWVGLHDTSPKSLRDSVVWPMLQEYEKSADTATERRTWVRQQIAETLRERGLLATLQGQLARQYFRFFDKDSYLTDMLPGGDLTRGAGYDEVAPALALSLRSGAYASYALLLILAAIGVWTARPPPKMKPWWYAAICFVLLYLGMFLLLHVKSRYRIQLLPIAALWAGLAIDRLPDLRTLPRGRVLGAGLTTLLVLFLAFAGPLVF